MAPEAEPLKLAEIGSSASAVSVEELPSELDLPDTELRALGIEMLMAAAEKAGLRLSAHGEKLRVTGPATEHQLVMALRYRKLEVLQKLRASADGLPRQRKQNPTEGPENAGSASQSLPVWDASDPFELPGYFPCRRIIRQGIEHKVESCSGRLPWHHVWGGRFCRSCWPDTDPLAVATIEPVEHENSVGIQT